MVEKEESNNKKEDNIFGKESSSRKSNVERRKIESEKGRKYKTE